MYADRFESIYGREVNIKVTFGSLKENNVGVCIYGVNREIILDREFWDEITDAGREELIFHEFGHCILNLGHDSTFVLINGNVMPKSIMYPYIIGGTVYLDNRGYYLEELKTSKANEE